MGEKRSRSIPWSGPEQCQRESPSPSQAKGAGHVRPSTPCPGKYVYVKKLKYFFSDCHLHFVDSAPVLGVLGLSVAGVDDLLVVVEKLLADRTLGVQVLGEVFWSKSSFFSMFFKVFWSKSSFSGLTW